MSKTAGNCRSDSAKPAPAVRESLKLRTREVLSHEIGFMPNPVFREFDVDRHWLKLLAASDSDSVPTVILRPPGQVPPHLASMCSAPLLSPEEERDLFCSMNYLKYRANAVRSTLSIHRPSARKLNEITRLLSTADRIRNSIVTANTRLVVSIVKKFADATNPFDDLLSEGITCLLKAVDKFDFDRGFRFSTYATMAVRREVFRLIKRSHRERMRFCTGSEQILEQQLSLDGAGELSDRAYKKLNRYLSRMMSRLDEREQFIVQARHGLVELGMKPTFSKLGKELGVSKERVRQLELRALNKLRDAMKEMQLIELQNYV